MKEQSIYPKLAEYLESLGYGPEMMEYEYYASNQRIDLLIKVSGKSFIVVEATENKSVFNLPQDELAYHPIARRLQRSASELHAKYYVISNGEKHLWLENGLNGRPVAIDAIYFHSKEGYKQNKEELVCGLLDHAANFLRHYPITGNISVDLSIALYVKVRQDLGLSNVNIPESFFTKSEMKLHSDSNALSRVLSRWDNINFYNHRNLIFNYIDAFLVKNKREWQVPRWLANFMVNLYPENEPKALSLDLFARHGALISSAHNNGWNEVKGFYLEEANGYWVKLQQLLATAAESTCEFDSSLLIDNNKIYKQKNVDCVFLAPPFGATVQSNAGGKVDAIEVLISKAMESIRPSGYVIVVVPDSLLISMKYNKFRKFLIKQTYIQGIIKLGAETFKPHSLVAANLLIIKNEHSKSRSTFFASLDDHSTGDTKNTEYKQLLRNCIK